MTWFNTAPVDVSRCGPTCKLATVSDTKSGDLRTIVTKCGTHGMRVITWDTTRRSAAPAITALVVAFALMFAGCATVGNVLIHTGFVLSCGPIPLSPDQCEGRWFKPASAPSVQRVPASAVVDR